MEQSQTGVRPTVCTRRRSRSSRPPHLARNAFLFGTLALFMMVTARTEANAPRNAGFERFRVIAEKNIFGRHRRAEKQTEARSDPTERAAVRPDVHLIGIVRTSDPLVSIAIIETDGRQRLCRVGDQIGTLILRSIRDHDIVFETPGGHWLAEIEPGTPLHPDPVPRRPSTPAGFVEAMRPSGADPRPRLPIRAADVKRLARAGLVACRENGVVKGVELTHDAMGLKQGDRLTHVAGQALSSRRPRQKLWQIVRKHAATRQRPAGIHVVVERNRRKIEFLLTPVG
jgi:type II secretory pathway component PulC